jgi:hypothetical protein
MSDLIWDERAIKDFNNFLENGFNSASIQLLDFAVIGPNNFTVDFRGHYRTRPFVGGELLSLRRSYLSKTGKFILVFKYQDVEVEIHAERALEALEDLDLLFEAFEKYLGKNDERDARQFKESAEAQSRKRDEAELLRTADPRFGTW